MIKKKRIKQLILIGLLSLVCYLIYFCNITLPIISGYGAKNMCSSVFLAQRNEADVRKEELGFSPMRYGTFTVDYSDSSVTGSLFGLFKLKAVYRKGLGATLISEIPETELRKQRFVLAQKPVVHTDTIRWPMGDKQADTLPASINTKKLTEAVNHIFMESDPTKPIRTRAVIVLYDGKIVAEQYASGYSKNSRLLGWSMTKSVTGALIGILVKNGKLDLYAPAPVPEWQNPEDPRHAITIKNLLQQSSGLDFVENYAKSCDATKMLFQRADMGAYTASHPLKYKPDSIFYYSSGNSNILSRIIRQCLGDQHYHSFPYDSLFYKLGMYSAVMEPDESGTFVGSSYMYATARDWARFGLLYYNKGFYNKQRILTEDWVAQSAVPASASELREYGFQFWLNAGKKENPLKREYPSAPTDMYYADGYEGQRVFIIPSKKLVVVRLGLTQYRNWDSNAFIGSVIAALETKPDK